MSDAMFRRMQQTRIHNLEQELRKYEWISVKDRLPEMGMDVLVTDGLHTMVTWCENTNDGVKWVDNYYTYVNVRFKEVTHWMPLPESPKKKYKRSEET